MVLKVRSSCVDHLSDLDRVINITYLDHVDVVLRHRERNHVMFSWENMRSCYALFDLPSLPCLLTSNGLEARIVISDALFNTIKKYLFIDKEKILQI